MKFLTIVYIKPDGTIDRGTTAYDTMDAAEIQFHTALASAMTKDYTRVIAMIFNESGEIKMRRVWVKG